MFFIFSSLIVKQKKNNKKKNNKSYLLGISFSVWQFCGHVEHYLFIVEVVVDWLGSCLAMCHIQATTKTVLWKKLKKALNWFINIFNSNMPSVMMCKQRFFCSFFWTTFRSNNHRRYSTINPNLGLKSKENYNVIR